MSCPLSLVKYDRMWHLVCLRNLYYQGCFNTVLCFVAQSCPTLWPHRLPGSCVCGDSPGKNTGMGCYALFQGIFPKPGIESRSPTLQADSLPSESSGKPKNTGVGSLSLLQEIFLTQESNWGLLHCRQILYQLSYQRAPIYWVYIYWITLLYTWK